MSLPSAIGTMPQVSATAAPPLLPPQVLVTSNGLRVAPNTSLKVCDPAPSSGVLVLPHVIAPAARMPRDDQRVGRRHVIAVEPRSARRADAGRVDQILVRDRQPVQHAERAATCGLLVRARRVGQRAFGHQRDDGVDLGVDALDPRQMRRHDVAGGHLLAAQTLHQLDRREVAQPIVCVGWPRCTRLRGPWTVGEHRQRARRRGEAERVPEGAPRDGVACKRR